MSKLFIEKKYNQALNELLNNKKISLKAKGLFEYLQSKPDGWKVSEERISLQLKEGKSAIREALHELEKFGYLRRERVRNKTGKWDGRDYYLYPKAIEHIDNN